MRQTSFLEAPASIGQAGLPGLIAVPSRRDLLRRAAGAVKRVNRPIEARGGLQEQRHRLAALLACGGLGILLLARKSPGLDVVEWKRCGGRGFSPHLTVQYHA